MLATFGRHLNFASAAQELQLTPSALRSPATVVKKLLRISGVRSQKRVFTSDGPRRGRPNRKVSLVVKL
jgi:hypothetical protein